jgi:phage portal protein BeeE
VASLLGRALGRRGDSARHITSVDDYISAVTNSFSFGGMTYPMSGLTGTYGSEPAERIPNDLQSYAQRAYAENGIVFAVMSVRMLAFSAVRFQWQRLRAGAPSEMFGSSDLTLLEQPWPGGTTQDLLARVIQDADLCGNSYWVRGDNELVRLRPDWVQIVLAPRHLHGGVVGWRTMGYAYWEGGIDPSTRPAVFMPDEVAHFAPNPDPLASYRGMSWLTPVLREVENDKSMGRHKSKFFQNAATPNLSVALDKDVSIEAFKAFAEKMDLGHSGVENAYKTLYLGGGADVKVIGADFHQMDFKSIQGHGETRIAAAGGTPPVIVGLSEGLSSATYSNYAQARRRFADGTMHPLWQNVAGCFANIVDRPGRSGTDVRLWYDARDVPFLREDRRDAADILNTKTTAISTLIMAGYSPESAGRAVDAEDLGLLEHTGLVSVQLYPPGAKPPGPGASAPDLEDDDDA